MPGLRWRSDASIPQPLTPGERTQQLYPVSQGLRAPPQEGGAGPCTRGLLGAALRPISAVLRQDRVALWLSISPVVRVDLYIFLGWRLLRQRRDEAETQRWDRERGRAVAGKGRTRAIRCWGRLFPRESAACVSPPPVVSLWTLFPLLCFSKQPVLIPFWPSLAVFCINDKKSSIPRN